jgi:amino acid transporter
MVRRLPSQLSAALQRRLSLPLLVLYGIGITIGAGIYVLIGAVGGHAGRYAPWSFVLAAAVMALTVGCYAELTTRFPVSAGEAAYVRAAFHSRTASTLTGRLTIVIGIVSSAAVALGAAGYIAQFTDLPPSAVVALVLAVLGAVAAWGILESVLLASLFTLIKAGGLIAIIVAGLHAGLPLAGALAVPPLDFGTLSGIGYASLLAFFAFIGFEDLANVVEEAKVPHRDIPRAMMLTLVISSVLYVAVAAIAVAAVPVDELAASPAPLSLVFRTLAGVSPTTISVIAIVATLNTILAQMTMAARVVYGRPPGRPARLCRPRASENGDAADRHCPDRGGNAGARAAGSVRAAGGRHLARHPGGVRAGQSIAAAPAPSQDPYRRPAYPCAALGAGSGPRQLSRDDGGGCCAVNRG